MALRASTLRVEVGPIPAKKKKDTIYFATYEDMAKVLTPNRVELLETIKKKNPESIYELAKLVGRDQGNVTKDVNLLQKEGFIKIEKTKEGREKAEPKVEEEGIEMLIKFGAGVFGIAKDAFEEVSQEFSDKNLEKNKKYIKENFKETYEGAMKPIKGAVKKVAKEFDIVTK